MTDHGRVIVFLCQIDRCERFGQRADLIYLDQNGIRDVLVNSFPKKFHVRDEKIVADQLNLVAESLRSIFSSRPNRFPRNRLRSR